MSIVLLGSTSGSCTLQEQAVAGTSVLTLPVGTGTVVANNVNSAIVSGTAVASTSGTSIDFTSIPSWVKRITVMFSAVSLSGTDHFLIQLGDSGGIETTGYVAQSATGSTVNNSTAGFISRGNDAANSCSGLITICNISGNTWVEYGGFNRTTATEVTVCAGTKTLSDTLTQLRITTTGTNTFDAGSINILYE